MKKSQSSPCLYNSATRRIEPIPKGKIGIYVCGITPYDTTHLGHAFTFIIYDVLVRYSRFLGRKVTYVQNVTDIDDDILIRAKATGENWRALGDRQTKKYLTDMNNLKMLPFDHYPRATDYIDQMIVIIKELQERGYAYESRGDVYFSVKKDRDFGRRLGNLNYEALLDIANERGNFPNDPNKDNPLDFVLWQSRKPGEPDWNSPWGKGRPGWHIECSAMSSSLLGLPVTVHGGGADLKFPHHEAEISQSEKASGKRFVKIWMHTAMVYSGEKKMSKSLGNMIFVSDLLNKYDSNTIRWYLLSHHYRSEWNYSEKGLGAAAKEVGEFLNNLESGGNFVSSDFFRALNNDLDTPKALKILSQMKQKSEARKLAGEILGILIDPVRS